MLIKTKKKKIVEIWNLKILKKKKKKKLLWRYGR